MLHIVLVEPEIPPNTGNIGRLCVGTCSDLYLVGKLGFEINNRTLRRAGLDYWEKLRYYRYESLEALMREKKGSRFVFTSTQGKYPYTAYGFHDEDYLVFGKESWGLGRKFIEKHAESSIHIPIWGDIRSINLSNSVAIILYEALRQLKKP